MELEEKQRSALKIKKKGRLGDGKKKKKKKRGTQKVRTEEETKEERYRS